MKCDVQQAIETYHHCDDTDDCFKAGMGDCNMDSMRLQTQTTMTGRSNVCFFALNVMSELRRRIREPMYENKSNGEAVGYKPLSDEMSWEGQLNDVDSIKLIYGRTAENVRVAEVTERQRLLAKRLRYEGIYDSGPEYAKKY